MSGTNVRLDHVPTLEGVENFRLWARSMKTTLLGEDLWKFVSSGKDPNEEEELGVWKPEVLDVKDMAQVQARRDFIVGNNRTNALIRRKLSPLVLESLPYDLEMDARGTWNHLRGAYDRIDLDARFAVRTHLDTIWLKNVQDVERFLAEFNGCFQKLAAMGKKLDNEECIYLVMKGLPDTGTWGPFKQNLQMRITEAAESSSPLSLTTVTLRIQAEARRIEGYKFSIKPGPGSEYTNAARESKPASSSTTAVRVHKRNPSGVSCTVCGKSTHDKEHCWEKGGGAEGQKPTWMVMRDAERASKPTTAAPSKGKSSATPETANVAQESVVDYGNISEYSCASILDIASQTASTGKAFGDSVLLDSGTTSHLIRDRSAFWTYDTSQAVSVRTANQGTLNTLARGDCVMEFRLGSAIVRIRIRDCLHAPDAVTNLLSVGRLASNGFRCTFDIDRVFITTPRRGGRTREIVGRMSGPLAFVDVTFIPPSPSLDILSSRRPPTELVAFARVSVTKDLWHARLGHVGSRAMSDLPVATMGYSAGGPPLSICEACILGKHPRAPHPPSSSRAANPLDLVHSDICSPFPVQTPHGKLYFCIFLDDHTHGLDLYLLATRDQVFEAFQMFHRKWELRLDRKVKALRVDNAGEYLSGPFTSYLNRHGIQRELSAPYAHQQNGRAERVIRTIEGRVRSMLSAARAPRTLWGEAALACAYLFMRTPSRSLPGKMTPYEAVYGRKPDLLNLRVWGCRCFARIPTELQTKLGVKSRECIFMGYPEGVKGYRVRDRSSSTFFNSRDVIFDESPATSRDDDLIPLPSDTSRVNSSASDVPTGDDAPGTGLVDPSPPDAVDTDVAPGDRGPGFLDPSSPVTPPPAGPASSEVPVADSGTALVPLPSRPQRVRVPTELGRRYDDDLAIRKAQSAKRSAAWHARHGAIDARHDPLDLPVPPPSTPSVDINSHVFGDDFANLMCDESALLSIRSDKPRDPTSPSYDLAIPPASYSEARRRPDFPVWEAVALKEFQNLASMGVYTVTALPPDRRAIGSRWVFELKLTDGDPIPKGRLVAQGFRQLPGIDFNKTFAPVAKASSIRLLAAVACQEGWHLDCFDATRAFLWGDLEEEIYLKLPDGFVHKPDVPAPPGSSYVWRLLKSMYGLKQASRVWYAKIRGTLERIGFVRSDFDYALFHFSGDWRGSAVRCIIALHVDDGMGATPTTSRGSSPRS